MKICSFRSFKIYLAKYSIALPNVGQFRGLWERLPHVAKQRIKITALFVDDGGSVTEDSGDDKS